MIMRKGLVSLATVLLLVSPAYGNSWVEFLHSVESGEVVERQDTFVTVKLNDVTLSAVNRIREDVADQQYGLAMSRQLDDELFFNIDAHASNTGEMLPRYGFGIGPSLVLGNFVVSPNVRYQSLKDNVDLVLFSLDIELYYNNWRLALRGMSNDDMDINSRSIVVQSIDEILNTSLFVSSGNEVLDIPLQYGDNLTYGIMTRIGMTDNVKIIFGGNIGERDNKSYGTITTGLRIGF